MSSVDALYQNMSEPTAVASNFDLPASSSKTTVAVTQTASTATDSGDADAGTITSSDFLTLLVTELKNQDPTSDQDPNAYITQLVQVNSLQQLISINQDLTPNTTG